MDIKPSGLLEVHHSEDGEPDSWTKIDSDVFADSELEVEAITNELTDQTSQSGESLTGNIQFLDYTDHDTVKAFTRGAGKAKKFLAFVFDGGVIYKTTRAVFLSVTKNMNTNRRDGDTAWVLGFELHATEPYEEIESLESA
jgi:hypothetical protein